MPSVSSISWRVARSRTSASTWKPMQPSHRAATPSASAINSLVFLSSAPSRVAARASAEVPRAPVDARFDVFPGRQMECFAENRLRALQRKLEAGKRHRDRARHDKGEARIPGAGADRGEVEKVEHLCRVRHAGYDQPEAEDQTDDELQEHSHDRYPQC